MFPSVGSCCFVEFASTGTWSERYAGQQMKVKVREYCVLKLTVIHNTSAQIAKSPSIYQREGGGRWGWDVGSEQRMFRPREYKHSAVCGLKRLSREGHEACCPLFRLCSPSPRKRPDS